MRSPLVNSHSRFCGTAFNLFITRAFGLAYREAITTVIIGSSSHFEIAIATAVAMYGVGSYAALGTTMGLFWEVPIMLGLVYLGKALEKRGFWSRKSLRSGQLAEVPVEVPVDVD